MNRLLFTLLLFISGLSVYAQKDSIEVYQAFRITDYLVKLNDTTTVVQISIPGSWPMKIREKQVGILSERYESGKELDTALIAWGRCQLIKSEWYYFAMHKYHEREPRQGDLLYTACRIPKMYVGILFNIARNGITVTKVDEAQFYNSTAVFSMTQQIENAFIDSMVQDIRYTGKAMIKQNDGQDQLITGGIFGGKKLFAAMQAVTRADVQKFLRYMAARPKKYAGNVWKIAELFATWMTNKTPTVIDE